MAMSDQTTKRITTLGILSALGTALMIIEIPYPIIPYLTFDLSDVVVLVVFVIYGWKEASLVGILKALVHLLVKGPVGYYAIGQITAFIASMSYVFGMYMSTNKLNLNRVLSAVVTVVVVTTILTVGNYLFITPVWIGYYTFLDVRDFITPESYGLSIGGNYLVAILIVYVPFNILKGILITGSFLVVEKVLKQLR